MQHLIAFVGQIDKVEEREWLDRLNQIIPQASIVSYDELTSDQYADIEIAIVANPDPAKLNALPNLIWIHSVWAGVERMVAELSDRDFDIVRLIDPELSRTMAEASLAWTLYLHRNMPAYAKQQKQKIWKEIPYFKASQRTVGVLGLGALGAKSAEVLNAQGFNVVGWSKSLKNLNNITCFDGADGLAKVLACSDILLILLPLTENTRGLLDRDYLALLKKGAAIINFARAPIIEMPALLECLENGSVSHAVLDVFEEEPLEAANPLWSHPDITVLPHISAPTDIDTASKIVGKNIARYIEERVMPDIVARSKGY